MLLKKDKAMINSCTAQGMRQKQLGRINNAAGLYDKGPSNSGVGISINIPGEEPYWTPRTQFPWIFFPNNFAMIKKVLKLLLFLFYYLSFFS